MRHLYRFFFLPSALSAVLLTNPLSAEESEKSPFQHISYATAWKSSRKTGRPMLLFITMNNCHYCRKMKQESYHEPRITGAIKQGYEAVAIRRSVNPRLVSKLSVRIFPTTFIIAPDGKIVDRIEGFVGPEKLAVHLRRAERTERTAHANPEQPAPTNTEQRK